MSLFKRVGIIISSLYGYSYKFAIKLGILIIPSISDMHPEGERVIVSLTSYGRRVEKIVYFTIVSLLRQSYKPDIIVLYLDKWQWNDNNIPVGLSNLRKHGLIIRYTDGKLKSYKKLVHALEDYPNDTIITVDDDMYYRNDMIQRMVNAQKNNPHKVYSNYAHLIQKTDDGKIAPYNRWTIDQKGAKGNNVFLLGVASCIYRRDLLYKDVTDAALYTKLAPNADDIWFFFMEILNKTQRESLSYKGFINYPLDSFYQYTHNDSLNSINCGFSQNDVQFKNVMDYYSLSESDII